MENNNIIFQAPPILAVFLRHSKNIKTKTNDNNTITNTKNPHKQYAPKENPKQQKTFYSLIFILRPIIFYRQATKQYILWILKLLLTSCMSLDKV